MIIINPWTLHPWKLKRGQNIQVSNVGSHDFVAYHPFGVSQQYLLIDCFSREGGIDNLE